MLYANTRMSFALCSKARCHFHSNHANTADCRCDIYEPNSQAISDWKSCSVGPIAFSNSQPIIQNGQAIVMTSNFALANLHAFKAMPGTTCQFTKPHRWANCFGVTCKRIAGTKGKALCQCPIEKTNSFNTIGAKDPSACITPTHQVWSAATPKQSKNNLWIMLDMYKTNYPKSPPTHLLKRQINSL